MLYFKSDFLHISFDESLKSVVMDWKTAPTSVEFKTGLNRGLDALKDKRAVNWLAYLENLGALDEKDQQWSNEDWFPRALGAGVKNMAIVVSSDIFNQMTVESIMSKVPGTALTVQYFNNAEKAQAWLRSVA